MNIITEAMQKVIETYKNIEVLIYNVRGDYKMKEPLDMTFSDLDDIYKISQEVAEHLIVPDDFWGATLPDVRPHPFVWVEGRRPPL